MYAMIALWLANLGRSTAAGIAGGLVWWFLEGLLAGVLALLATANPGPTGDFIKAIPDYFIATNMNVLLTGQSNYLTSFLGIPSNATGNTASVIPDWRAWLVIAVYLVVFVGSTWLVLRRRDITN
jgi:ABC-type transport system involved in multi-copper enzyme maturation permease subunit